MREMRNDADNAQICAYVCKYTHIHANFGAWPSLVKTEEDEFKFQFHVISCSFSQVVILMGGVLSSAASIDVTRQFCE